VRPRQIKVDDTELTYCEQGSGELVILVHGALGDYRTWNQQAAILAKEYHVISYSRRCHQPNSSTNCEDDYTYRRHVDDLIAIINALGIGPAHLIGHSYGATVAALAAMQRPEMVNSLVLGEPNLFSILSNPHDKVSLRFHEIALGVVQKLSENGEAGLAVREYLKIVTDKDAFDELPIEGQVVISQNAHTLGPMLNTLFDVMKFGQDRVQSINTPTMILSGESSPILYQAISRALHSCLPNSQLHILARTSHGLHLENPIGFSAAVLDFLRENEMAVKQEHHSS
jgi:pimeloyl-ACP methyl ester carboxylesterase